MAATGEAVAMGNAESVGTDVTFPPIPVRDEDSLNPTRTWEKLSVKHKATKVVPLSYDTPKPEGHTRFVCISDTHNRTNADTFVPEGDVLLHAGDFSMVGAPGEIEQFVGFIKTLPHKHKVVIAGNHDLTFDPTFKTFWTNFSYVGYRKEPDIEACRKSLIDAGVCTYLEDSETTINGIRIYGSPWQPEFGGWGFNLPRGEPCRKVWEKIPEGIDILITHGPPIGHGDLCTSHLRAGCVDLLREIQERVKPKYHIFGHIHEGYGITTNGYTTFINASTCTLQYRANQKPIIFDLPNKV